MAKEDRGFASMDRAKQREIASKGGKAAHQKGTAHEWTSEEAREAGRKGGMASHRRQQELTGSTERGRTERGVIVRHVRRATTVRTSRFGSSFILAALSNSRRPGAHCARPLLLCTIRGSRSLQRGAQSQAPQRLLGGRSTVGHVALDHVIGVRIPASQPT